MKKKISLLAILLALGLAAGIATAQSNTGGMQHHNGETVSKDSSGAHHSGETMQNSNGNNMMHHKGEKMMNGGAMMGGGNMMGGKMMSGQQGMGCGGMNGGMMMNKMNPEQQQKFMDETVDLRKKMMETRFAYMETSRTGNASPEELAKIETEMQTIRSQMMAKMNTATTN
jgi:hypothetical protein